MSVQHSIRYVGGGLHLASTPWSYHNGQQSNCPRRAGRGRRSRPRGPACCARLLRGHRAARDSEALPACCPEAGGAGHFFKLSRTASRRTRQIEDRHTGQAQPSRRTMWPYISMGCHGLPKDTGSQSGVPVALVLAMRCTWSLSAQRWRICLPNFQIFFRQTDRVVSALQPTWLIGLGRARTRDQPGPRRKGYPDRFRGSPPRSSVDAMPDLIVLLLPCR